MKTNKPTLRTKLSDAPEEFRPIIKLLRKLKASQAKLQQTINKLPNDDNKNE
jgi:hypothetical protein